MCGRGGGEGKADQGANIPLGSREDKTAKGENRERAERERDRRVRGTKGRRETGKGDSRARYRRETSKGGREEN